MHISCAGDVQAGMSQKDSELQLKFYRKNKINLKGAKYFFETSLSRLKKPSCEVSVYHRNIFVLQKIASYMEIRSFLQTQQVMQFH